MSQTFKHHTTRTAGILVALASSPFFIGGSLGAMFTGSTGSVLLAIFAGFFGLFFLSGILVAVLGHRGLTKARRKLVEKEVLRVIAVKHGRVTASEIATSTALDIGESREMLQRLCDMGEGEIQILPSGKFLYVFDEFLPLDQKEAARNPYQDPLNDLLVE